MKNIIVMEFEETGGYDSMTGAWAIYKLDAEDPDNRAHRVQLVLIDQDDFGQAHCDYDFRSEEAERLADAVFEAVKRFYNDDRPIR
jgi:hypothetical protein